MSEALNHQKIWDIFENIYSCSNRCWSSYVRSTSEIRMSEAGNHQKIWDLFENMYSFQDDFELLIFGPHPKCKCVRQGTTRKSETSLETCTVFTTTLNFLFLVHVRNSNVYGKEPSENLRPLWKHVHVPRRIWISYFGATSEIQMFMARNHQKIWDPFEHMYIFQDDFERLIFGPRPKFRWLSQVTARKSETSLKTCTFVKSNLIFLFVVHVHVWGR